MATTSLTFTSGRFAAAPRSTRWPRARRATAAEVPSTARLLLAYMLMSAVPVLALGAALGFSYRQEAVERSRAQGRAQGDVITQMVVLPALTGQSLELGVPDRVRERLQVSSDLAVRQGALTRLRLRSFSGSVAFSDDGSSSLLSRSSAPFRAALRGETHVSIVEDPSAGAGRSVRVLGPVLANAAGRPTGVLELYLPYEPIASDVQQGVHQQYALLGTGLVLLSGVLGVICWRTTRRLRRVAALREHEARHDGLTGLPNRAAFESALDCVTGEGAPALVALLDLDGFKQVNDLRGHRAGDLLLKAVADVLCAELPAGALAARLGGDEFALVLPGRYDEARAQSALAGIERSLVAALAGRDAGVAVGASFGGALHPAHATEAQSLLHCADLAMYEAKYGTSSVRIYRPLPADEALPARPARRRLRDGRAAELATVLHCPSGEATQAGTPARTSRCP